MYRFVAAFLFVCVLAPAAFGQIVYENVRYQYVTATGQPYYYGGNNPRTFYLAERQAWLAKHGYNRYGYFAFSGGERGGDGLLNPKPPVYSDLLPYNAASRYGGAARYGFDASDARNEAYRSAPRYFRKIDLLRAAEVQPDGSVLVPSHPRMVVVIDRNARNGDGEGTTKPATTTTGRVLIIPKPKPATSDKPLVASR